MKVKTFGVLGIALASSLCYAQQSGSSVSIYGRLDVGVANQTERAGGTLLSMGSSYWQPSQIGFKGAEDLGQGTSAIFDLASTLNMKTGGAGNNLRFWDRNAYVGISNKDWGTITVGRNYVPLAELFWVTDPLRAGNGATNMNVRYGYLGSPGPAIAGNFGPNPAFAGNSLDRQDNSIRYAYDKNGMVVRALYALGEAAGNRSGNSSMHLLLGYDAKAVQLRGVYAAYKDINGVNFKSYALGGVYTVDKVKIRGTWTENKIDSGIAPYANMQTKIASIGATWSYTPTTDITAAFYNGKRTQDGLADQTANKLYLVGEYWLSKRTELIGVLSTERFNAAGSALDNGTPLNPGARSSNQIGVGISHTF
jgi:predicted porin